MPEVMRDTPATSPARQGEPQTRRPSTSTKPGTEIASLTDDGRVVSPTPMAAVPTSPAKVSRVLAEPVFAAPDLEESSDPVCVGQGFGELGDDVFHRFAEVELAAGLVALKGLESLQLGGHQ